MPEQQLNLYRIMTSYFADGVDTRETYHMAATSLESALEFFKENVHGEYDKIISIVEIVLEAGHFYDL